MDFIGPTPRCLERYTFEYQGCHCSVNIEMAFEMTQLDVFERVFVCFLNSSVHMEFIGLTPR